MDLALKHAEDDLPDRRVAWAALSDLFLDTDTSLTRSWRVQTLAATPYSIEQLEFILAQEVYPICKSNLLSIAGEWSGFDQAWLESRILKRLRSPFRRFHALNLGRLALLLSAEWQATKSAIRTAREKKSTI